MNSDRLRDFQRRLDPYLPSDRGDRIKLLSAAGVILVCLLWFAYYLSGVLTRPGPAKALDTPAWRTASSLNEQLLAVPEYLDTGVAVESEQPLKLKIVGAVRTRKNLDALRAFLSEIRPQNDYEIDVEIIDPAK